jgi:hypothetical protein
MRHIRVRRRYRIVLLFLFALASTVLVENRIEALVPELKAMAAMRVESALGGNAELAIGSIEGGIVQPIVLNGVRMESGKNSALFQSLDINNIRTNFKVWDLFRIKGASDVADALQKGSAIYVNFSMRSGAITGFAGIEGNTRDSRISGYVRLFGSDRIEFTLAVKGDNFDIAIHPKPGSVRIRGAISDDGVVDANFKIEHVKFRGSDVVCEGRVRNKMLRPVSGEGIGLEGDLATSVLLINQKELPNLKAGYRMDGGSLDIADLDFGGELKAGGKIGLKKPNAIDLTLLANNLSLNKIFLSLGARDAASMITGTMNGKFTLKGPAGALRMESKFDIRQGTIGTLDFSCLTASLKGDLPFLKIEDARMTRPSGYLALAGEIDMTKAGKTAFFRDVKLITDDNAIAWDEWRSTKTRDTSELSMAKNLTPDIGIRYKRFVNDGDIDESRRSGDQARLEYRLTQNESLGVMIGKDREFFGFEHRDKF